MSATNQDQNKQAVDAELMQTNAMQDRRIKNLEAQLKLAVDALAKVNNEKKAQIAADRQALVDQIVADGKGKLTADSLKDMEMPELKAMRIMADVQGTSNQRELFASVAALQAEQDSRKAPLLTAGKWNGKEWIGGL